MDRKALEQNVRSQAEYVINNLKNLDSVIALATDEELCELYETLEKAERETSV